MIAKYNLVHPSSLCHGKKKASVLLQRLLQVMLCLYVFRIFTLCANLSLQFITKYFSAVCSLKT